MRDEWAERIQEINSNKDLEVKILSGVEARPLVDPFYEFVGKSHRAHNDDTFFVLMDNNNVLGVVRHCIEKGVSMLRSMNIHPNYRGKKLGLILLKKFELFLREQKIEETFCIPYSHLLKFYSQIGFEECPEINAPSFLQERLKLYRETYLDKSYSLMYRKSNNEK